MATYPLFNVRRIDDPVKNYVWDVNTLSWVAMQQPVIQGGTITVTGALTDSQLRASPVEVRGTTSLTPSSPTAASVGAASAQVVAANSSRKGLILVNTSDTATISLGFGATAVLNSGPTLAPKGSYNMGPNDFYTGAINAIASAGSTNLAIQEFT